MWSTKALVLLLFCVLFSFNLCEVENRRENAKERQSRLFTFNTVDDVIEINLEFSIPFLSIPSMKTFDSAFGLWSEGHSFPAVNINPSSLVVGGAAALSAAVLVPLLSKLYAFKTSNQKYSRLLDHAEFSSDGLLELASQVLVDHEVVRGCTLRVACWTARGANRDQEKTWRQIMSNNLVTSLINSTTIEDAMLSSKNGRECSTYTPCPLQEQHIPALLNNIAAITKFIG